MVSHGPFKSIILKAGIHNTMAYTGLKRERTEAKFLFLRLFL